MEGGFISVEIYISFLAFHIRGISVKRKYAGHEEFLRWLTGTLWLMAFDRPSQTLRQNSCCPYSSRNNNNNARSSEKSTRLIKFHKCGKSFTPHMADILAYFLPPPTRCEGEEEGGDGVP